MSPGITLAYRLGIPSNGIASPVGKGDGQVIWLPNAAAGEATEIDIILVSKNVAVDGWPGKRSMGTSLVGSVPLDNGDTAFAVYWAVKMPDMSKQPSGRGRFFRGMSRADLVGANLRAVAIGVEPDGSRTIYDLAVNVSTADGNDSTGAA